MLRWKLLSSHSWEVSPRAESSSPLCIRWFCQRSLLGCQTGHGSARRGLKGSSGLVPWPSAQSLSPQRWECAHWDDARETLWPVFLFTNLSWWSATMHCDFPLRAHFMSPNCHTASPTNHPVQEKAVSSHQHSPLVGGSARSHKTKSEDLWPGKDNCKYFFLSPDWFH